MGKFESMDFCFDLMDYHDRHKQKYIALFLQKNKDANKTYICHSKLNKNVVENIFITVLSALMEELEVDTIQSSSPKINKIISSINKQQIEYLSVFIDKKDVEIIFNIKSKESLKIIKLMLFSVIQNFNRLIGKDSDIIDFNGMDDDKNE
jgi:hypothetical protein